VIPIFERVSIYIANLIDKLGTRHFGTWCSCSTKGFVLLSVLENTYKHFYSADALSLFLSYTYMLFEDMHVRLVKFAPRKGQTNFMTPYAYTGQSPLYEIIVRGYCFRSFVLPCAYFNSEPSG
jgi:hypothetical protein